MPALNEENAIASTLRSALAAREQVLAKTAATEMRIVFVDDGSTDRTREIVEQAEFNEIVKVRFPRNRGYGAAIKAGWRACDGELVGFIDADGTCDPAFSVALINHLLETGADVVLAARLNPDSKMPRIRRIGNWLFSRLLGVVSGKSLSDTASGFRVVRRSSLSLMAPLPDGLHFTPAMSSICLLDPRLSIRELPMPYRERIGRSKLRIMKDGIRFLYTILFSACCYSPLKTMLGAAFLLASLTALVVGLILLLNMGHDLAAWLTFSAAIGCLLLPWGGVIIHQLNLLLIGPRRDQSRAEHLLQKMLHYKLLLATGIATIPAGGLAMVASKLAAPDTQTMSTHATMALALLITFGTAALITGLIVRVIWAVKRKQDALTRDQYSFDRKRVYSRPGEHRTVPPRDNSAREPSSSAARVLNPPISL